MLEELRWYVDAARVPVRSGVHAHRAVLRSRGLTLPTKEHLLVVAPAGVHAKQRPGFEAAWRSTPAREPVQAELLSVNA